MQEATKLELLNRLQVEERFMERPYKDINGNLTIGIGWNLEQMPMTLAQARYICAGHINTIEQELMRTFPIYSKLSDNRKAVLVDMGFQLGLPHLETFKNMFEALDLKHFSAAADEMLDSQWGRQFKTRASALAQIMRTDMWI